MKAWTIPLIVVLAGLSSEALARTCTLSSKPAPMRTRLVRHEITCARFEGVRMGSATSITLDPHRRHRRTTSVHPGHWARSRLDSAFVVRCHVDLLDRAVRVFAADSGLPPGR